MNSILILLFRTLIGYLLLTIAMKIMGKRDIGQLSLFDFLIVLSISDIMIIGIENFNQSIWFFIIPMMTIVLVQKMVAVIELKWPLFRDKLDGSEQIIIKEGKLDLKVMIKEKYNMNDLYTQLRGKNIRTIEEVEYAVLETNGNLSVFTYAENKEHLFPFPIIVSGKIKTKYLKLANKSIEWVNEELKKQGINSYKEIYGASIVNNHLQIVKIVDKKIENN